MEFVPPSDNVRIKGAWRLAVRDVCQAVWNWISPGGFGAEPSDNARVEYLFALDVCGLQCFGDTLKIDLLECFLSCGLEWYPLSCGSGYGVNMWDSLSCDSE
ncbi:hypothetical protein DEO72_LG9g1349 [Vigna unguiculata]|uniref:Uncharacterized protein n=1 Tax=Vigna unguiculata TaxID=3917 RepID=A0A4D6N2V4_VIGUN|nr:hypothetical protein DEO72_LG9g1349 [Vigna unguiculata]